MRYCPNCQRINVGSPQICNYCGRTWYVRLCPSRHENSYDAQYCGTCGSTDLTDTVGSRPWWRYIFRIPLWIILILFAAAIIDGADQVVPMILSLSLPVVMLILIYSFAVSFVPGPLKGLIRSANRKLITIISNSMAWMWSLIKWIFIGKE